MEPGTRLGPYQIVARVGAGGMGEVFRAHDTRLERAVAIKILPPAFAADTQMRLRFDREARTISPLSHPHICTLYDVGTHEETSYLVMELLEGETLAQRVGRGAMPPGDVLRYGAQIAAALARAHSQGVVHRDLKPANVMITKSGAKLLDFGLAKPSAPAVAVPSATDDTAGLDRVDPLTEQGTILGTVQYMAPEQLEGKPADTRTDIFAFGAVLYEMATGRRAFEGKTATSLVAAIMTQQPPPIVDSQPLAPAALEHLVYRCLEKDPDERWQSAHDVAEQLRFLSRPPTGSRTPGTRRWTLAALTAAGLAVAGATALIGFRPAAPQMSSTVSRFVVPLEGDGYSQGLGTFLAPDGRGMVFTATNADGDAQLFVQSFHAFAATPVAGTQRGLFHAWSPDSRWILFSSDRKLQRVPAAGGAAETLAELPDHFILTEGTWNEAGDILIGEVEGPLLHLPPGASRFVPIAEPDPSRFEHGFIAPTFLPDGRTFLVTTFAPHPTEVNQAKSLYAGRLGDAGLQRVGPASSKVKYARGHVFSTRQGSLVATPFDAQTLSTTGSPTVIASNVWEYRVSGHAGFDVSNEGSIVFRPSMTQKYRVALFDAAGNQIALLATPTGVLAPDLQLAHDGSRLVATVVDPETHLPAPWEFGLHRPTATKLTSEPGLFSVPLLSPDGRTLFYTRQEGRVVNVYRKSLDGSQPEAAVRPEPTEQYGTSISPDGRFILLQRTTTSAPQLGRDVHVLEVEGSEPPRPITSTRANETEGRFSPDGRWVSFVRDTIRRSGANTPGQWEVFVKPFPGPGAEVPVTTGGADLHRWRHDGKAIFFLRGRTVSAVDFDAGRVGATRELFDIEEKVVDFVPLPDGRFVVALTDEEGSPPPAHVIVRWPDTLGR